MLKKLILLLPLLFLGSLAEAQTASQSVSGFLLAQGSTYNGYTCPSAAVTPCFVQYGSTVPTGGGSSSSPSFVKPAPLTIVPLDVSTVTTGGTAVTALAAGHRAAGGFIQNPPSATVNLCINEQGAASGTTSAGATTCIVPGQSYTLTSAAGAVSVISSDSAHPFSGYGLN